MQIRALGLVKVRLGHLLRCRVGLVRCDHLWLNGMGMTTTVLPFRDGSRWHLILRATFSERFEWGYF